jgi:hypothetical protein
MGSAADDLSPSPPTRSTRAPVAPVRVPDGAVAPRPAPAPAKARPVAAPVPSTERRYLQTINHVDLWSVLKVSVCFYICSMAVFMVALVALWVIGDATGVIGSVEKFLGDLLQTKDFTFLDGGGRGAAHRGHRDRRRVLQLVRRDLRRDRDLDHRRRVGSLDHAATLADPPGL